MPSTRDLAIAIGLGAATLVGGIVIAKNARASGPSEGAVLENIIVETATGLQSVTLQPGQTVQFFATGIWSDGVEQDITNDPSLVWDSSDPFIADNVVAGLVTAHNEGTAIIGAEVPDDPDAIPDQLHALRAQKFTIIR